MQGIFFFYICILHIFLHSFSAFVYHFCISLSAFLFLHFRFRSFPLHSAFVILFCFSNPLCQHSSFLILLIRISFQFPFFSFSGPVYLWKTMLYIFIYLNKCLFPEVWKLFSASCSWATSCSNSFSHPPAVHFLFPLLFVVSLSSPPPPCCRQAA